MTAQVTTFTESRPSKKKEWRECGDSLEGKKALFSVLIEIWSSVPAVKICINITI